MLAPRFIVSPAAVTEPSVVPTFEHTFPLPILELQARRLAGLPGTQPWLFHSDGPPFQFLVGRIVCSWPWLIPPARDRTRWKSTSRLLGRQHWALPTRRTPSSTVCGSHGARPYGFAQANGRTSAKPPRAPQPLSTVKICNLFRAQGSEAPGVTSPRAE